jgi:hypothetical protein
VSERRELISNALKERFRELFSKHIPSIGTAACDDVSYFRSVRERLPGRSPEEMRALVVYPRGLEEWMTSYFECRPALLALSLGDRNRMAGGEHPPVKHFLQLLKTAGPDRERSCELLEGRYGNPLNFTFAGEEEVREYVLMKLMTSERAFVERGARAMLNMRGARVEKNFIRGPEREDLLLKLNLVAVQAARTPDLRFLDALNYYYELLPALKSPTGHNSALLGSFLALYGQALAARM